MKLPRIIRVPKHHKFKYAPRHYDPKREELERRVEIAKGLQEDTPEARKAILIAEMTEEFMKEENKITSQMDSDPLLKLKSREVDLRAMENERKKEADQTKADFDRAKLMQSRELAEDKMDQNEELAELRAGVSLAKKNNANIN